MSVLLTGLALDIAPLAFAQNKPDAKQDYVVPFEAKQSPLFYFKRETFQPYVGGVFKIRAGANSVDATLDSVRDCTPSPKSKLTKKARKTECFALIFHANGALTDLTTIYDIEHAALGTFALFLTRRDGPNGTFYYEAVFNHAL